MRHIDLTSKAIAHWVRGLASGLLAGGALMLVGRGADGQAVAQSHRVDQDLRGRADRQATVDVLPMDVSQLGEGWGDPPPEPRPE